MPALREARDRVLAAGLGDGTAPEMMIEAVRTDPGLAIAVTRRANQRINGAGPATSVGEAIERLGPQTVNAIAASIETFDFLEQGNGSATLERFRIHALATQRAADAIARRTGSPERDQIALIALIHDIGKIAIARLRSGELRMPEGGPTPEERLITERREFGIDHALVGGVLARRWGLPARLTSAIERHHADDTDGIGAIVKLADMLAHHEQGEEISVPKLRLAADACELLRSDLEELLYDQPMQPGKADRPVEPSPLSGREMEVLRSLSEGKVYKQIALDLDLSVSTVRTHLHNVYAKLGVIDRAQAVLTATDKGWL